MDHSIIDKEKIEKINEGLWTVNRFEFYVEIENDKYYRLFNQNELAAIQTQIIVSNLVKDKEMGDEEEEEEEEAIDENYIYEVFSDHFKKMKQYRNVVEYLNFLGIAKFESIKRKKFVFFSKAFNEDWLRFKKDNINIYENRPKIEFLTDNILHSAFRVIGEIIQSNKDNSAIAQLDPYLKCILGVGIPKETFQIFFKEFIEKQKTDVLFDSFKLGHSFCQYFSKKKVKNQMIFERESDKNIYDSFSESNFLTKIHSFSDKNNIIFIKVNRPSHCYHCIRSITRIITNFYKKIFYLNEKTLIFCKNDGNFVDRIKGISKTSVKDTKNKDSVLVYFIIHPEMLNEKDHSFLVEFLDARLNFYSDSKLPKVYIISSFDYRTFCYKHVNKFKDVEIQISKDLIEKLCELSHPDDPENLHHFQLYYSANAGSGKTYQIIQDFKNKKNCVDSEDHVLKSLFVDLDMKKLPKLLNENNQTYSYVHLDLSPELFDNNYEFFDNLWTLAVLGYQINSDGSCSITPKNIFIEVPTLTKKQFPDGGFISKADFPIFCDFYHRISTKKTKEEEGEEPPPQIKIPDNVKKFCDEIFAEKNIENTSELLLTATKIFYPKIKFDESYFVPRILEEINILMEEFCKSLSIEDECSKAIFLLLLRTNFHIWNMESLFAGINKSQPKTFIIMSNQNLFSSERDRKKWILLCFNSIGEDNEWNTEYLKGDIGKVNESTFFENKFFKKLLENRDIEIYSNQINYENDQAYFFNIIRKFFYFNNDITKDYRNITDGVILNDVRNNDSFGKIKDVLSVISQGKDIYEQRKECMKIHKWTTVFDSLYSIFKAYEKNEQDLVYELSNNERVQEICNVTLTMTLVKRFVVMIIRIILKQPLIFEGFTGVGKTWSVKLLKLLVEIAEEEDDFNWAYHQIDCHGALQLDELLQIREKELNSKLNSENHIFFFDELNTSSVSNYVINEMNNYYLKQKNIPKEKTSTNKFDFSSIVFIAAINPYLKVDKFSRSLSLVGIKQIIPSKTSKLKLCNITPKDSKNLYEVTDLNKLAYNVRELSNSTKMIVLKSDPELFYFNKEDIEKKNESSEYLPTDEIKTIGHIIDYYLNNLIQQIKKGQQSNLKNEKFSLDEKAKTAILDFLEENKKAINNIIHSLLCKSFLEIRELMCLKSILSFRDVKRTMQFFILFFTKLIKVYIVNSESKDISNVILVDKIVPQSIVLTIMISIVYRFSNKTRIETVDGNISNSNEEEEKILARCAKFGLNLAISKDKTYINVSIRSVLLEKLMKISWTKPFKKPDNWNKIVQSYAWLKCMKYVYYQEMDKSALFKLKSLMTHLFAISSCYSVCRNNKDSVMPCLIIGMPGTSKTLAIQLFTDYKQKKNEKKNEENNEALKKFFSTTYLSTRVSEAEGLNAHYRDCAMFMLDNKDSFAVCVIDELGLANLNETRPLKLLHYYFDKGIRMETENEYKDVPVMSIAASNYALDYANMNRGILICTDLPTDSDIAEAFYFSELESQDTKDINIVISDYKKNYFNDDYNFFKWQNKKNYTKYSYYLQTLWELTDNKERPDMLTLRPLYLLFNSIFHNTQNRKDDEFIDNLCLYIISAISCSPSVSFEKVKKLIDKLNDEIKDVESIKNIKSVVDDQKTNNFKAFKEIFNGQKNNYFYLRFCKIIDDLINKSQNKKSVKKSKKKTKTKTKTKKKAKTKNNDSDNDDDKNEVIIKNLAELNKINDVIKTKKNPFVFLRRIINKDDENDDTYQALKTISANDEIFADLTKAINDSSYDNYKILRQFIKPSDSTVSKRALCFRTKNYECLDFIEELIRKTSNHLGEERAIKFLYVYPSDFKLSKQISADNSIQLIIDKIENYKKYDDDTLYYLLIVGNVCITDALLDLLNTPNQGKSGLKTKKPLISKNGFSVELDEFPKNIVFCFVMNEKDFYNRNSADSFPVPLLDRLNQLYLDYDQKDEFGIIEKYKKYNDENNGVSTPYSQIIHNYFRHFVSSLKYVPEPKEENHYAVVYATTDIDSSFSNSIEHEEYKLSSDYDDIEWNKKIILFKYYRRTGNIDACNDLINALKVDEKRIFTFYWSNEYDKLYEAKEKFDDFELPLPKPINYDLLENDGSINNIINAEAFDNNNNKEETNQVVRAIIVTTSPLMENLKFNSKKGITTKNTLILYDQYISSGDDFQQRIDKGNEEEEEEEEDVENVENKKNKKSKKNKENKENEENEEDVENKKSKKSKKSKKNKENEENEENKEIEENKKNEEDVENKKNKKSKKNKENKENEENKEDIKNIIVRLNNFQPEHDRYLRELLENQENKSLTIIIYHIKNSIMPEGLYASLNWPVYWIESITNSPLSEFPTTEIVECIRFRSVYKAKAKDIYIRLISQIYHDIDNRYENHIKDSNKISEIINYIYINLSQKKSNNKSIIDMIDFSDIIDKFEGKTVRNSFKNLDFKREFYNSIVNQIPFLEHLIQILILNKDPINERNIKDTQQFISKIFEFDDIEKLFEKADIDNINYQQHNTGKLYFPELVFPEVIKIYDAYNKGTENYPEINKQVFKIFCDLQIDEQKLEVILETYFNSYFQSYVSTTSTIDKKYNLFVIKIKELMK